MPPSSRSILAACVACLLPVALAVAHADDTHPGDAMAMPSAPADMAIASGMARMQRRMQATPMTGDPDHDFVAMMIPHHAGAIDMANAELRYGKDPALKQLARGIVAAQRREVATMQAWMRAHPNG